MKELRVDILPNPYFWSPKDGTIISSHIEKIIKPEISFIQILLNYPVPSYSNVDLFQFIDHESLNNLRSNKTILIFDSTFEGFSPTFVPIAQALYYSCTLHNINPKKIFLFTGNLLDNSTEINVIPIFILDNFKDWDGKLIGSLKKLKALCNKNYQTEILSLSRRNRSHRIISQFMLFNSDLYNHSIISQDIINFTLGTHQLEQTGATLSEFNKFKDALPLIADANQFDVNDPFNPLLELHSKTAFSIVNETLVDNVGNTTLFFSEKFLKPIINFQPMLIYGHQGINKKLNLLGFKSYESYFDLDFDDEPDDILRYKKLLNSAEKVVNTLKQLSKDDRVKWRFSQSKLLKYNYNIFIENIHRKQQIKEFESILNTIKF